MESISDIVETLEDPQFFRKKLQDLENREKAALKAESSANNQIKALEIAQEQLKKEEDRLRREVTVLKEQLEGQVGYHQRVEAELRAAYDEKMTLLDERDKKLRIQEEEATARIAQATQRENLADKKMQEVKRREGLLDERQERIDHNTKLMDQLI